MTPSLISLLVRDQLRRPTYGRFVYLRDRILFTESVQADLVRVFCAGIKTYGPTRECCYRSLDALTKLCRDGHIPLNTTCMYVRVCDIRMRKKFGHPLETRTFRIQFRLARHLDLPNDNLFTNYVLTPSHVTSFRSFVHITDAIQLLPNEIIYKVMSYACQ